MPRIDPLQLLKCVSVLLSPTGGIRSGEEVQRLVGLMTKYSKKLVSKCIYVSILKATETKLLEMFMSAGGWNLIFTWLSDGVTAKNWPLVAELVDLLLICPVDIDKLKSNACPKLIKSLSKDATASENVRVLACKLVEVWLKVVRAEKPESQQEIPATAVVQQIPQACVSDAEQAEVCRKDVKVSKDESVNEQTSESKEVTSASDSHLPVYKITTKDGKKILTEVTSGARTPPGSRSSVETVEDENNEEDDVDEDGGDDGDSDVIKPVKISKKMIVNRTKVSSVSKKSVKLLSSVDKSDVSSYDSSDSSTSSRTHSEVRRKDALGKARKERIDAMKNKLKGKSKVGKDEKLKEGKDKKDGVKKSSEGEKNKKEKKDGIVTDKSKEDKGAKDPQIEKDKETISKLIPPSISKIGKIPKKSKEEKEPPKMQMPLDVKKPSEFKKPIDLKRPEKNFSVSVKINRIIEGDARPKTVKTYNSKFRSTGLEEEIRPPPPRPALKKPQGLSPPTISGPEKKAVKRGSPPPPDPQPPEKKVKPESLTEDKKVDKAGGIKLIPPKPKPMFLQESDVFMDALTAANKKEPRKKRKPSVTKEVNGPTETKKETQPNDGSTTPPSSPVQNEKSSPPAVIKPTFKFYQDTLETDGEQNSDEIKQEVKMETGDSDMNEAENDSENTADEKISLSDDDEKAKIKIELTDSLGTLKGVLVHFKSRRGPKKSVSWRGDKDLEAIRYFELDETERVNVTKTFTDMKQMERINERENFQMARKLAVEDIMEERTRWTVLIPVDVSGVVVVPGKNSNEKDIQYAREKTVAPAIYFHKRAIPDTPSEPDLEIHATTDPTIIPLDDVTGSADSINDFTMTPWPEPQSHPPAPDVPVNSHLPPPQTIFPVPGPIPNPYSNPGPPFNPGPPGNFMPGPPAPLPPGDWRTGDGKLVPVPDMYPGPAMMPGMGPPGPMPPPVMMPPGHPDMGFPPMGMPGPPNAGHPDDMGPPPHPFGPPPFSMGGPTPPPPPPPPPLFPQGIPQGPQGGPPPSGNYQGGGGGSGSGDSGRGGRGSWYRNNSGPYSHGGGGGSKNNWRGGGGGNGGGGNSRGSNHGWGCNSRGICNMFLKRGFCRNNSCPYRHS